MTRDELEQDLITRGIIDPNSDDYDELEIQVVEEERQLLPYKDYGDPVYRYPIVISKGDDVIKRTTYDAVER